MTNKISFILKYSASALMLIFILALTGCEKKDKDDDIDIIPTEPSVGIGSATMIGQNWATMKGSVNPNGLETIVTFEYGTTEEFGNSIRANPDTLEKNTYTIVSAALTGLDTDTQYYFRLKAVNSEGTVYGGDTLFTSLKTSENYLAFNPETTYGTLTDIEGNIYKTVQIGSQTWMAENLRTLKLNDGVDIPYSATAVEWSPLDTASYCWISTDTSIYGALYNWYTVDTEKLCPEGWSVPSDQDWTDLTNYLGGQAEAGKLLKETGTRHWLTSNTNITNDSGFTALPGGYRNHNGAFGNLSNSSYFWTSTKDEGSETAFFRSLYYGYADVDRSNSNLNNGFSVRCIMDPVTK